MKKFTYHFLAFIFLIMSSFISIAHADSTDALSQLLKNMHSLQASFVQTLVDKNGNGLQKSSGKMSLQRPNQFRWDVLQPNRQLIVTNGKRLWIYDPDLEQVSIRSLSKAAGETPAMLLSQENLTLTKEFSVRPLKQSGNLQWFLLIPKDKSSVITSLKLAYANQTIREMHLQDQLGHTTIIQFSNIQMNKPLSASLFAFKPPARVDVIDETRRR